MCKGFKRLIVLLAVVCLMLSSIPVQAKSSEEIREEIEELEKEEKQIREEMERLEQQLAENLEQIQQLVQQGQAKKPKNLI